MKKIVVGITGCGKFSNYERWMLGETNVEVVELSGRKDNAQDLARCDGLLLTGGEDVHPKFYHQPEKLSLLKQDDMDEQRDEFELGVIGQALENNLPLLGICRGLQIVNVFLGGTLIADIPTIGKPDHSKVEGKDRYHLAEVAENTILKRIVQASQGEVNSAHHQAAENPGNDLVINALSPDGIIEGLEWREPAGRPYFMLIQWHPERMRDLQSPFSKNIRASFTAAMRN